MASAELEKRKREEYEMQLLGFHSRTVYAILRNSIEMHIKSKCLHLNNVIIEKYNLNEEEKAALKENIKDLKKLYMKNAQPEFENLQRIVEKYIRIPDNVLLEEDKCQAVQYSDEEFRELNEKLKELQKTQKRVQVQSIFLDKELEATKGIETFLNSITKICGDMEKASNLPEIDRDVGKFIEKYKTLNKTFKAFPSKTLNQIYNPSIDHIQLIDCDPADCK